MVALTRIKNNQITDSTINAASKVQSATITGGLLANNLTYGSDLTVSGNLTVNGQTTTIDTNVTTIEDPVILLASTQTGSPTVDIGFIGERGTSDNIAFVWDESADEFVTAFTSTSETNSTITISSYSNFHTNDANIGGNIVINGTSTLTGNANINGNLTVAASKTLIFGDNVLANVGTPTLDNDAATKAYVDGAVSSAGFTVTDGVSNATIEGGDTIEFTGTASEISVTQSGNAAYAIFTFGLPDNVTVTGNLLANKIDSNTTITATGNLSGGNITTGGVVDATGTITGGNLSTAGTATATGNITGGNLLTGGVVDATGTVTGGNLSTAGTVNATGNITGGNLLTGGLINATGTITATGNVSGGNITTGGVVDATGTITGGNLSTAGTMTATGNVSGGNITTGGVVDATGTITGGNLSTAGTVTATGNVSGGNVNTAGIVSATGNLVGGNVQTAGVINSTGNITGGNLVSNAGVYGTTVDATGNITGGNLSTTGTFSSASISATGNITGGNLITTGIANIGTLEVTGTGTVTGNLSGGNVSTAGLITATGNITGGNLVTTGLTNTGTLQVSGNALVEGNLVVNGNLSYINIDDLRVQDPIIVLGTGPNGAPLTTNDGLDRGVYMEYYTTGLGNAFMGWDNSSGNMVIAHDVVFTANDVVGVNTYGTLQAGNLYVESAVSVGNVTGGNINTAGQVVATGNITGGNLITLGTFESASISATGNITGGNLLTGGLIDATGNVDGGNFNTAGKVVATGNVSGGNVLTGGYVSATGNVSGGNVTTGGVVDATGTITGGNLSTAGTVTATGNVSGGNVTTAGVVDATGNITGGNINTAGKVAATGNLETGANVVATGYASITGNVTGGNLVTAGVIDATGTITGGNLSTAGTATATGNITGGNLITGGLISVTGNINGTGAVFSGNVTADTFIGNISGNIDAGGSNTNIQFNDGDLLAGSAAFTFDKTSNAVVASGNITGGNLITAGLASVTGNITGGNLITAGLASVTGNVTGGNINTAGQVVATGNVNGGNVVATALVTGANVTATSNVSGANVVGTTAVIGGNIVISGDDITDVGGGIVTINSAGADVDFAVSGDTVANVFYVDAGTGTTSFGSATQTTGAIAAFNTDNSILLPVGNTGTRPGSGVTGMVRFNTTNNNLEVYDNSQWSAVGVPSFTVITNDSFAGDGTTVAFTLSESASTDSCIVSINGVVQIPTTAYSVSGTTLTFTEAPLTGDAIDVRILTTTTTVTSISNASGNAVVETLDTAATVQITGDLLPGANNSQSLGSSTKRWSNLWVSGSTITLGNVVMKNVAGGNTIGFYGPDGTTPATIAASSVDTTQIQSGTSSMAVVSSGGNIRANIGGATIINITSGGIENGQANGVGNIGSSTTYFNTVFAKATSAQYADLAEKYVADAEYPAGTVVVFGGDKEVTVSSTDADRAVAGVVSTNPSYIMNGGLEAEFVATVALTGRVPCRVTGTVKKGDLMVSAGYGLARAEQDPKVGTVIGKALENFEGNEGVIEVVVGRF